MGNLMKMRQKAFKQGYAEGFKKGYKEGRKQGYESVLRNKITNLLANGISKAEAAYLLEITPKKLNSLLRPLKIRRKIMQNLMEIMLHILPQTC